MLEGQPTRSLTVTRVIMKYEMYNVEQELTVKQAPCVEPIISLVAGVSSKQNEEGVSLVTFIVKLSTFGT